MIEQPLARDERERFAEWLEQEAEDGELLAQQFDKLPRMEMLARMNRNEAATCRVIVKQLRGAG